MALTKVFIMRLISPAAFNTKDAAYNVERILETLLYDVEGLVVTLLPLMWRTWQDIVEGLRQELCVLGVCLPDFCPGDLRFQHALPS